MQFTHLSFPAYMVSFLHYLCLSILRRMKAIPIFVERSVVERRTRNQVSPGLNHPLVPFRRLGIFVLSIDAPVDSSV